jgi:hypothetical protein
MREPITKFPKRATGPHQTKAALAECLAMLAKPRLSPEIRQGLEARVQQLRAELRGEVTQRARDEEAELNERSDRHDRD